MHPNLHVLAIVNTKKFASIWFLFSSLITLWHAIIISYIMHIKICILHNNTELKRRCQCVANNEWFSYSIQYWHQKKKQSKLIKIAYVTMLQNNLSECYYYSVSIWHLMLCFSYKSMFCNSDFVIHLLWLVECVCFDLKQVCYCKMQNLYQHIILLR